MIALPRRGGSGPPGGVASDVLTRVALALNSTLELREVLRLLTAEARAAAGADRCSVFLLDGRLLRPTVSLAAEPDRELWRAFHAMGPVRLDRVPGGWDAMLAGRAVAAEAAADHGFLPREWVDRFGLESAVLVPLLAAGEPCGLMVVDYRAPRSFDDHDIAFLEAMASYAGVAVRNARLFETTERRARLQEALARGTAALVSPLEPAAIARTLVDAYTDLTGASLCAIALFDRHHTRVTTLAARGVEGDVGPIPFEAVPDSIVQRLTETWEHEREPVRFEDEPWFAQLASGLTEQPDWYLVVPLPSGERVRGGVVLGFDARTRLTADERGAIGSLAAIAAAAIERTSLLGRLSQQLRRLEVLYGLSSAITERADARLLVSHLDELLADEGIEVASIAFRDRTLARRLNGETLTPEERAALKGRMGCMELPDATLSVPMRLGRKVVGTLRVRPVDLLEEERAFLELVGHGVAEVATRGALRSAVEEGTRERAVAAERDRIAADLHDTVGQLLVAVGLLSRRSASQLPGDSAWGSRFLRIGDLAERGKWEIDQAIRALAHVPAGRRGLVPAMRSLARSFQDDSGIQLLVEATGKPVRLSARLERALYRVAHESLVNAWRHARCALIRIELHYGQREVSLSIRDDGVGLGRRVAEIADGLGMRTMRRAMDEVGGSVRVHNAKPRGVLVEATARRELR